MRENNIVNTTSCEIGNPPNWEARSKETENKMVGGMKKRDSLDEKKMSSSPVCVFVRVTRLL